MERRTLSLVAAALLATAPAALASTQAEMEQLITFLASRIQTEDPSLTEALRYRALLESLEMMGVTVSPSLRTAAPKTPASLAKALLTPAGPGAPAPTRPAGMTVVEAANPFEAVPPAGSPRPLPTPSPTPSAPPAQPEPGLAEVGPNPVVRPAAGAASAPVAATPVVRGPPAPQRVRSPRAYDLPPIARLARELLENPGSNPWKPVPKPVGLDRSTPLGPAPVRMSPPAPIETAPVRAAIVAKGEAAAARRPALRSRLRDLLDSSPARAEVPTLRSPEPSIQDLRAKARQAVAEAAQAAMAARALPETETLPAAPALLPQDVLQNQASAVLEALREPLEVPAPSLTIPSLAAHPAPAARTMVGHADLPRVAVAPGGRIRVVEPSGTATVHDGGRHPVAWNSTVTVETGDRVMVVYPTQGTIFRLHGGSVGRLEAEGVRRVSGTVERFLGRPDDGLQVLESRPSSVPAPDLNLAHPELPRLELPRGARAAVLYDGLNRTLGPGHHVIDWNSLVRLLEGDSARLVYPITEKVYNFTGSAEGYVETSGVRSRSGHIQSETL